MNSIPKLLLPSLSSRNSPFLGKFATPAVLASILFASIKMASAQLIVHEPFEDSSLGDASGQGFETGSTWNFAFGQGTVEYLQSGLTYIDSSGNQLVASGGAAMISTGPPFDNFRRTLEAEIPAGGNANYWISFLLRRDTPSGGDCFWSSGGGDHGAFGLQGNNLRLVNGTAAGVNLTTGVASALS